MKATVWLSALFISAVVSACTPAPPSPPVANKPDGVMCTEEAKLCPDGKTYVGRNSANHCQFDPCPTIAQPPPNHGGVMCTMEVKMCSDGKTYVSRKGPSCAFAACPGE